MDEPQTIQFMLDGIESSPGSQSVDHPMTGDDPKDPSQSEDSDESSRRNHESECEDEADENTMQEDNVESNVDMSALDHTHISLGYNNQPPHPQDAAEEAYNLNDDSCPSYLKSGFDQYEKSLCNFSDPVNLNLDLCIENLDLLRPGKLHEVTMDSGSKTLNIIPYEDSSRYMQPYEGGYYYFISDSNGMTLSRHMENVLYFFYMLETYIQQKGVQNFVVPTKQLSLDYSVENHRKVIGVLEILTDNKEEDFAPNGDTIMRSDEDDDYTFRATGSQSLDYDAFMERVKASTTDNREGCKMFTTKLVYTGAFFDVEGKTKNKLFSMIVVTPLKNFNLYDYIIYMFVSPPSDPKLKAMWIEMDALWKHILWYESNFNLERSDDPMQCRTNPGAKNGFFSLTNMLTIPYRMLKLVHKEYPLATSLRIIGCPSLLFSKYNPVDVAFQKFMNKTMDVQAKSYSELKKSLLAHNSMKENEQKSMEHQIFSFGGWPLKSEYDPSLQTNVFQRFGHFKWPIMMQFEVSKHMGGYVNIEAFLLNLGVVLPLTVTKKLRDFVTYDADAGSDIMIPDAHILKGVLPEDEYTPLKRYEKYYGADQNVDDLKDTKLAKWYIAFKEHIFNRRTNNHGPDRMSIEEAMNQLQMHLYNSMKQHESIARADGYGSKFFKQCMYMLDKYPKSSLGNVSLSTFLEENVKNERLPPKIKHHAFLKHMYSLMLSLHELNADMRLNALNLEIVLETLLSGIHWHVGAHGSSFIPFFQCLMIASGVGHFEFSERDTISMDWRKPNSCGAGFCQALINKYLEETGKCFMITKDQNKLIVQLWNRNTAGALEGETCVGLLNGTRISGPDSENKYIDYAFTENRQNITPYATLILIGFPRDDNSLTGKIFSTADPSKTGQRELYTKIPITHVHFCMFSTNELPPIGKEMDVAQTLWVVMPCVDPGTEPYMKPSSVGQHFNSAEAQQCEGRPDMNIQGEHLFLLLKHIFFSTVFAKVYCAKPHNSGIFPFHINVVSNAYLNWTSSALKLVYCVMNQRVVTNIGRIKQGYESRQVAMSIWIHSLIAMAESELDTCRAGINAMMACAFDPLPVVEVANVLHNELRRGLHAGLFSLVGCFIQAFHVPVIPPSDLCDFFNDPEVDPSNYIKLHTAKLISEWIKWLANHNCFCPEDSNRPLDAFSNIKCYISSPADQDGRVTCDSNTRTILRFFNSDGGKQCVEHAVAELIYSAFGGELKQYCHVSNEPCIIKNLVKSVAGMEVDLRILMDSSPIYCTRKHILKLGLQSTLGGLANSMVTEPDKFMKVFQWKTQGNTVASQGMGINMWSLLTLASLAGSDDIHCKTRDKAAQNILSLILKMAPAGATPCNTVCVRSFHKSTTEPQCVFVTGERRCHHFLRPIYDLNFALTGNFSLCAHVNDKMPEDYLHCSALLALSNFLSCEVWEIPPDQVTCRYSLMPDIHYCAYRHSDKVTGDLILLDDVVSFETETGQCESLDVNHWERELRQLGFVILPCLFRSGALVRHKDDDGVESLGCPVPDGCLESMGRPSGNSDYVNVTNYDHENKCYHLRIRQDLLVTMHAITLFQNLVVPGTLLWIKGGSETFERLKVNFPDSIKEAKNIDQCMVRVRLNVPNIVNPQPGVIYVTYMVKNRDAFAPKLSKCYDHGVAMPWELSLEGPREPHLQITELYV